MERLLRRALEVKLRELDNYVHRIGLIEFGNTCEKNCLYRYLLRIESSDEDLYYKIHPKDAKHSFSQRIGCLESLLKTGYQTGQMVS